MIRCYVYIRSLILALLFCVFIIEVIVCALTCFSCACFCSTGLSTPPSFEAWRPSRDLATATTRKSDARKREKASAGAEHSPTAATGTRRSGLDAVYCGSGDAAYWVAHHGGLTPSRSTPSSAMTSGYVVEPYIDCPGGWRSSTWRPSPGQDMTVQVRETEEMAGRGRMDHHHLRDELRGRQPTGRADALRYEPR